MTRKEMVDELGLREHSHLVACYLGVVAPGGPFPDFLQEMYEYYGVTNSKDLLAKDATWTNAYGCGAFNRPDHQRLLDEAKKGCA